MAEQTRLHVHLRGGGILLSDWVDRPALDVASSIGNSLSQGHAVNMPVGGGDHNVIPCSQIRYVHVEIHEYDEIPNIPEPVEAARLASVTIPQTGGFIYHPQPPIDGADLRSDLAALGGDIDDDVHFDDSED